MRQSQWPGKSEGSRVPVGLEPVPVPRSFYDIRERITKSFLPKEKPLWGGRSNILVIEGFEDVLGEPFGAGGGSFYNTATSINQLIAALSLSEHPAVQEVLGNQELGPREIVNFLRKNRVLENLKVMDLGSGGGEFASTLTTLGADAYTADAEESWKGSRPAHHVVVDLNDKNAVSILLEATGGNFDMVSENIIGGIPGENAKQPSSETVINIGDSLLKPGGYLYYSGNSLGGHDLLRKLVSV